MDRIFRIVSPPFDLTLFLWMFLAYLIGSISFAVLVSRLFGLKDPRSYGSGNPGATNVLRSGNKWAAALTLAGDAAKGWFAVWLAQQWLLPIDTVALVALAVFLGHLYPVFLRFKGGKGVATAAGIMIAIEPLLALATFVIWLCVAKITKMSSLAALTSAVCAPVVYFLGGSLRFWQVHPALTLVLIALGIMLLFTHRENIRRICAGTESKIGKKK